MSTPYREPAESPDLAKIRDLIRWTDALIRCNPTTLAGTPMLEMAKLNLETLRLLESMAVRLGL